MQAMLSRGSFAVLRFAAKPHPGPIRQFSSLWIPSLYTQLAAVQIRAATTDAATDAAIEHKLRDKPGFSNTQVAFQDLHGFTDAQLESLCKRSSVAARMGSSEFDDALLAVRRILGMSTEQLVTFMGNSVAVRVGSADFIRVLLVVRDKFSMSTEQLVTFMSNSVAKRIHDERFQIALKQVIGCTGLARSVRLFKNGSFASRIDIVVDEFCALVEHCRLNGVGPDDVVMMLGNGKLNGVIPQLWQELSQLEGGALVGKIAEYNGTYAYKNTKALELMARS